MRMLRGPRQNRDRLRDAVVLALEREVLVLPGAGDNLQLLVEAASALIEWDFEGCILALVVATARAKHGSALAEQVEQRPFLSNPQRVVAGKHHGGRSQLH